MKKDFKFKSFFKKKALPTLDTMRAEFTVLTPAQIAAKKAGFGSFGGGFGSNNFGNNFGGFGSGGMGNNFGQGSLPSIPVYQPKPTFNPGYGGGNFGQGGGSNFGGSSWQPAPFRPAPVYTPQVFTPTYIPPYTPPAPPLYIPPAPAYIPPAQPNYTPPTVFTPTPVAPPKYTPPAPTSIVAPASVTPIAVPKSVLPIAPISVDKLVTPLKPLSEGSGLGKNLTEIGNRNTVGVVAPTTTKLVAELTPPSLVTKVESPIKIQIGPIHNTFTNAPYPVPVVSKPFLVIDPKGGTYQWPIHVRSFIATKTVAGELFRGDGRNASTIIDDKSITSRVKTSLVVDPTQGGISKPYSESDTTKFHGASMLGLTIQPRAEKGTPIAFTAAEKYSENTASFDFSHSGKDPVIPLQAVTPALDVHASLTIREDLKNGILNVSGSFTGDKFPSTEAFIVDQSGKTKLFLGAKKEKGGVLDLVSDNKLPLFNVDMQIQIDKQGNFIGVKQGDKMYSVESWNKKNEDEFKK